MLQHRFVPPGIYTNSLEITSIYEMNVATLAQKFNADQDSGLTLSTNKLLIFLGNHFFMKAHFFVKAFPSSEYKMLLIG